MTSDPSIDPFAPCPCGSGKKWKFCCRAQAVQQPKLSPEEIGSLLRRAQEFPVEACYVNSDWPTLGKALCLLVRRLHSGGFIAANLLVDPFFLGLKDAFGSVLRSPAEIVLRLERMRSLNEEGTLSIEPVPYEEMRSLVLGAIAYAGRLGQTPHPDWNTIAPLVAPELPWEDRYVFGREGKPFYISGPYDDLGKIRAGLRRANQPMPDYVIEISGGTRSLQIEDPPGPFGPKTREAHHGR